MSVTKKEALKGRHYLVWKSGEGFSEIKLRVSGNLNHDLEGADLAKAGDGVPSRCDRTCGGFGAGGSGGLRKEKKAAIPELGVCVQRSREGPYRRVESGSRRPCGAVLQEAGGVVSWGGVPRGGALPS